MIQNRQKYTGEKGLIILIALLSVVTFDEYQQKNALGRHRFTCLESARGTEYK
jgi:hypothetical protein